MKITFTKAIQSIKHSNNKRIFLLSFALTLGWLTLTAQTDYRWADSAAVWHYTDSKNGVKGYEQISYAGDTVINNHPCQKFESTNAGILPIGPNAFISVVNYNPTPNYYLYKSNDSVFLYKNNAFQLAFKTNALAGEIWDLGKTAFNNLHEYVKVDSVYYVSYNAVALRSIKVHPCKANGDSLYWEQNPSDTNIISQLSIINEKFGPLGSFSTLCAGYPSDVLFCGLPETLLCYNSSTLPYIQTNTAIDCFNNIFTGIPAPKQQELIHLFPNPSNNQICVKGISDNGDFSLYTELGKEVLKITVNSPAYTVSTEALEKGIYFYKIRTTHLVQSGKWIKE